MDLWGRCVTDRARTMRSRPRARPAHVGARRSALALAAMVVLGLGLAACGGPAKSAAKAGKADFCTATKTVVTGLVGTGGSQALSAKTVQAIEKVQGALATMRAGAPAPIRSDVDQVDTAWSPLLAELLAGAKHPGSKPSASFERDGNKAIKVLRGASGTAIGAWADAHCPGYAKLPTTTISPPTSGPPATSQASTTGVWDQPAPHTVVLRQVPNMAVEQLADATLIGRLGDFQADVAPFTCLNGESLNVWSAPAEFPNELVVHNGRQGTQCAYGTWVFSETTAATSPSSTTLASGTPDLFVSTGAVRPPGQLYTWPYYPTRIQMDNDDWIAGTSPSTAINWTASPNSAAGSGVFWTTLCSNGPGNNCTSSKGAVELSASQPLFCTVSFEDPATGTTQSKQVEVFTHLDYRFISGTSYGQTYTFPSPCS